MMLLDYPIEAVVITSSVALLIFGAASWDVGYLIVALVLGGAALLRAIQGGLVSRLKADGFIHSAGPLLGFVTGIWLVIALLLIGPLR